MLKTAPLSDGFGLMVDATGVDLRSPEFTTAWVDLLKHFHSAEGGALVVRGLAPDEHMFRDFSQRVGDRYVVHHNLESRGYLDDDLTFATVNVGDYGIDFHFEMASNPASPRYFWLFCIAPSAIRGRTGFSDGVKNLRDVSESTRKLFEAKKLMFAFRDVPPELWSHIIPGASTRETISGWLDTEGRRRGVKSFEFNENDLLTMIYEYSAIRELATGEKLLLLAILDNLDNTLFEDGTRPLPHVIAELRHVINKNAVWHEWQPGDMILLDNHRALHARESFHDPRRQIYVRYCESVIS